MIHSQVGLPKLVKGYAFGFCSFDSWLNLQKESKIYESRNPKDLFFITDFSVVESCEVLTANNVSLYKNVVT